MISLFIFSILVKGVFKVNCNQWLGIPWMVRSDAFSTQYSVLTYIQYSVLTYIHYSVLRGVLSSILWPSGYKKDCSPSIILASVPVSPSPLSLP